MAKSYEEFFEDMMEDAMPVDCSFCGGIFDLTEMNGCDRYHCKNLACDGCLADGYCPICKLEVDEEAALEDEEWHE